MNLYRLRFSVATLLLLISAICVALAIVTGRTREQRLAIERIRSVAGTVWYDYERSSAPSGSLGRKPENYSFIRWAFGDDAIDCVDLVDLESSFVTDDDLYCLTRLRGVKAVWLNNTAISDDGLRVLAQLPALVEIRLENTSVSDAGAKHLENVKSLRRASLYNTNITQSGCEHLRRSLPNCQILSTLE